MLDFDDIDIVDTSLVNHSDCLDEIYLASLYERCKVYMNFRHTFSDISEYMNVLELYEKHKIPLIKVKDKEELKNIVNSVCHLTHIVNLNFIDISLIEDLSFLFSSLFNKSIDVRDWNVTQVKDMHSMFCNCNYLEYIYMDNWDVRINFDYSKVIRGCHRLKQTEDELNKYLKRRNN